MNTGNPGDNVFLGKGVDAKVRRWAEITERVHRKEKSMVCYNLQQSSQGTESKREDRSLQVACYRDGDGTREFAMENRKESEDYLLVAIGFQVESATRYEWLTQRDEVREEGWVYCGVPWSPQNGGRKGSCKYSA